MRPNSKILHYHVTYFLHTLTNRKWQGNLWRIQVQILLCCFFSNGNIEMKMFLCLFCLHQNKWHSSRKNIEKLEEHLLGTACWYVEKMEWNSVHMHFFKFTSWHDCWGIYIYDIVWLFDPLFAYHILQNTYDGSSINSWNSLRISLFVHKIFYRICVRRCQVFYCLLPIFCNKLSPSIFY